MTLKKGYEIGIDNATDYRFIVTEGYADLSKNELEEMESDVRELDKKKNELAAEARKANQKIKQELEELEAAPKPWERQLNKYKKMNAERTVPKGKPNVSKKENKDPSKGGCKSCAAKGLKRLIQGGAALLKAELGMDAADEATIEKRKALCLACDSYDFGVCNDCGCFTAAKVKLKTGSPCPQGKW